MIALAVIGICVAAGFLVALVRLHQRIEWIEERIDLWKDDVWTNTKKIKSDLWDLKLVVKDLGFEWKPSESGRWVKKDN